MNSLIIQNLQTLADLTQGSKEVKDVFRRKAYTNAIKAIKEYNIEIISGNDAKQIPGIGKSIADKIQEIIDTGQLHQVDSKELEDSKIIESFESVWGIGPVKARELLDAGAKTIQDLKRQKYINLLTDNQQIGLKYFADFLLRIPRNEVSNLKQIIMTELNVLKSKYNWSVKAHVCGSYRRKQETCGDMDILLTETTRQIILPIIIQHLNKKKILFETLGLGDTKYMGVIKTSAGQAFRIDMEFVEPKEWPFALLYFTGSGKFNEKQRIIAKKKGYSLSEHGLKNIKTGEYIDNIYTEKDIFEFLEMDYVKPKERSNVKI